jgi:transposase
MNIVVERGCGIDIGQAFVVACALVGPAGQKPTKEIRRFGATRPELMEMARWLKSLGVTHVVMESTGIYWEPVYNVLEGSFELIVGNAQHIKNVPGRKTDVKDSEWLAELLRHGLIKRSFVPPRAIRQLRVLTRYRRSLVHMRSAQRNRILKFLETCNIKLSSVASDVFGVSGMLMLEAIARGDVTAEQMASLAKGQLRKKIPQLIMALDGMVTSSHREVLTLQLAHLKQMDLDIASVDEKLAVAMAPYAARIARLKTIPGVNDILAWTIIAETGGDLSAFASAAAFAAWVGVCPGNNESAGKHKGGKRRRGNVALTTAFVEAARSAGNKKDGYLREKYFKLCARRGKGRAAMAVAHKLAIATYHILTQDEDYKDLGGSYLDKHAERHVATGLVRRLERLGYRVQVEKIAA